MALNAKTDGYAASLLWDSNDTMPHFEYSMHSSSEKRGHIRIQLKRVCHTRTIIKHIINKTTDY